MVAYPVEIGELDLCAQRHSQNIGVEGDIFLTHTIGHAVIGRCFACHVQTDDSMSHGCTCSIHHSDGLCLPGQGKDEA